MTTEVICPCCEGTKNNPFGHGTCFVCKGVGTISPDRRDLLAKVAKDILRKLTPNKEYDAQSQN